MKMNLDQRLVKEVIKCYMIQGDDVNIDRFIMNEQDKFLDIWKHFRDGGEEYIKNMLLLSGIGCVTLENKGVEYTVWETLNKLSHYPPLDTQDSDEKMMEYCDDIPGLFANPIETFIEERNVISNKIK